MNATFHPGAVADAALQAVASGDGPLILSAGAPLVSAREMIRRRYMEPGARTIQHQQGTFYVWCGTHYRETDHEEIRAQTYQFLDSARQMADDRPVAFNPNRTKVGDVMDALSAEAQLASIIRPPAWLDGRSGHDASQILACTNGLLHLPTRALLAHTASFFSNNAVGYAYYPNVGPPEAWLAFLKAIWPSDQQSIDTLQEMFGLLLTGDTTHQKAFLVVGPKRSGKGTIGRVLTALLGGENVAGPTLSGLSQNFGLAPLIGKPLAIISDARLGGRADLHVVTERILAITGEDSLTIDRKYREPWTGRLPTRFLILTNELPRLNDASGAMASRFIVLRLSLSFFGEEDHALTQKLLVELPSILCWALAGRDRLAKRGHFIQPKSAMQAVEELADLASPIGAFLRQWCQIEPHVSVECDALYQAWKLWCAQQNRDHPGTVQTFGRDLRAAIPDLSITQPRDQRTGERLRYYEGVGLLPP